MKHDLNNSNEKAPIMVIGNGKKVKRGYARKKTSETFWNLVRIESGLTLQDVSDITAMKLWRISNILTGVAMPTDHEAKMLCELFGVPLDKGMLEFKNGYTVYHNRTSSDGKPRKVSRSTREDIKNIVSEKPVVEIVKEDTAMANNEAIELAVAKEIYRAVYQVLDFDDFMTFVALTKDMKGGKDDILKMLYQKVGYDCFIEVQRALNNL